MSYSAPTGMRVRVAAMVGLIFGVLLNLGNTELFTPSDGLMMVAQLPCPDPDIHHRGGSRD